MDFDQEFEQIVTHNKLEDITNEVAREDLLDLVKLLGNTIWHVVDLLDILEDDEVGLDEDVVLILESLKLVTETFIDIVEEDDDDIEDDEEDDSGDGED